MTGCTMAQRIGLNTRLADVPAAELLETVTALCDHQGRVESLTIDPSRLTVPTANLLGGISSPSR